MGPQTASVPAQDLKDLFSIFIPTYNRWEMLARTLDNTLSHNRAGVAVTIVDNNSSTPGRDQVLEVMARHAEVPCTIVKNRTNLGGDGNLLRCLELCPTPYVLVLGDDDFLASDYLDKIAAYLLNGQTWGFISFKADVVKDTGDQQFDSPFELMAASPSWADPLFISTSIYHCELFRSGMAWAQHAQCTHGSHLVGMLKGWEHAGGKGPAYRFALSPRQLVVSGGHARDHRSFGLISIYSGLHFLESVFSDRSNHQIIHAAVKRSTRRMFKPRVLAGEFFHFTLEFGLDLAWRRMLAIRRGLGYSLGHRRALFYKWHFPAVVLLAGLLRSLRGPKP